MKMIIFILVFFLITVCFSKNNISSFKQVKFRNGYAVEFSNGKLLTALHLLDNCDKVIYANEDMDTAILQGRNTMVKARTDGIMQNNQVGLILVDVLVQSGDSGKAYLKNGKLVGVIVGRKGEQAVISTISPDMIQVLSR